MIDPTAVATTPSNDGGNANNDGSATSTPSTPADQGATTPTETKVEPQVPDSYELQMPEGVQADKVALDEFTAVAKELKLDNATAQKVADVGAKMVQRQAEAHAKLVESWVEQVKADKEIGGDNLDANVAVARKAIETFGTPELKDVLNATGLGNHPALLKAFYKAGKAISDDGMIPGSNTNNAHIDTAKKLFPNMN